VVVALGPMKQKCFVPFLTKRRPDDRGSKHLGNVDKLLPNYTAQKPARQPSSGLILVSSHEDGIHGNTFPFNNVRGRF
jgi:hypothetical protein